VGADPTRPPILDKSHPIGPADLQRILVRSKEPREELSLTTIGALLAGFLPVDGFLVV
jgi:hypothetical protein